MSTLWFWIVALMLTAYVVLDGFDLGVGDFVSLSSREPRTSARRLCDRSARCGTATRCGCWPREARCSSRFHCCTRRAFSGFYLPLMMVLWLLMLRGVSIELRGHSSDPPVADFLRWPVQLRERAADHLLRGGAGQRDSRGAAWARRLLFPASVDELADRAEPGILDWYTVIGGVLALAALSLHGAIYPALKTTGDLNLRLRRCIAILWPVAAALTVISLAATLYVRPDLLNNYTRFPILFLIPTLVVVSLIAIRVLNSRGNERGAFLACGSYLASQLVGAAAAVYPNLLTSSTDRAFNITVDNAHSGVHGLAIGLIWWSFGMAIAIGYFVFMYRMFRGKLAPGGGAHGY